MHTRSPRRKPASAPPRGTGPLNRVVPVLPWITVFLLTLPLELPAQGICDRTPQVQDEILNKVQIEELERGLTDLTFDCAEVTADHLALVRSLWLVRDNITAFQAHDFRGLVSLKSITLSGNPLLTTFPEGIFQGLSRLERLTLSENSLTTLPDGLFHGLGELRTINIDENSLTAFPEDTFRGLHNLVRLDYSNNLLTELPESIFHGLSRLVVLDSSYNALEALPENIYRGLVSLERLYLTRNRLQELPEGIFRDLKSLRVLWIPSNGLSELPPGIFRGLRSLESLGLERNSLRELPKGLFEGLDSLNDLDLFHNHVHYHNLPPGIFDDVLDTLGGEYYILNRSDIEIGRLNTGGSTRLAVDSPGQQAPEGATVRVGVSLNGPSPVAIRVPYTIGLGRGLGGLEGFSPSPERGLLFRAGETRREIAFTVPEQAGSQGPRRVVLTLGKTSEIGIRRSDGRGPDAPYLDSGDVVRRRAEGAVHAVTISDTDPDGRQPFCFSLWSGARCWTAAVLPHAVAGLLRGSVARTELALTNRDPGAGGCEAALLFGRGTGPAGAVSFDGRFPEGNLFRTRVPRGGARILTLEAPEGEGGRTGAVHLFTRSPCSTESLKVEGRILMEDPVSGEIEELVSLPSQSPREWLGDGGCRVLTGVFGNGRDLVLSVATAEPDHPAPPGTTLDVRAFDLTGKFLRALPPHEISGAQRVLSLGRWSRPLVIEACLNTPVAGSPFRLAVTAIGSKDSGSGAQFEIESLSGGPRP